MPDIGTMLALGALLVGLQLTMKRKVDTCVMGKRCWDLRDRQDGIAMSFIHWKVDCVRDYVAYSIYGFVINLKKTHTPLPLPDGDFSLSPPGRIRPSCPGARLPHELCRLFPYQGK